MGYAPYSSDPIMLSPRTRRHTTPVAFPSPRVNALKKRWSLRKQALKCSSTAGCSTSEMTSPPPGAPPANCWSMYLPWPWTSMATYAAGLFAGANPHRRQAFRIDWAAQNAFLEQIPASSIDRVEVITNPSAKYDPDGMVGILNIILKKNKLQGFHGRTSHAWYRGEPQRVLSHFKNRSFQCSAAPAESLRYVPCWGNLP